MGKIENSNLEQVKSFSMVGKPRLIDSKKKYTGKLTALLSSYSGVKTSKEDKVLLGKDKITMANLEEVSRKLLQDSQAVNEKTQAVEKQGSYSSADVADVMDGLEGLSAILVAVMTLLQNQQSSRSNITSLAKVSDNLNTAVSNWQKSSTFWLQAFFKAGKRNSADGSYDPNLTPENINNYDPSSKDKDSYPGVENAYNKDASKNATTTMMGIWNSLSSQVSSASTRLSTAAGLPGQQISTVNNMIDQINSTLQSLMQSLNSILGSVGTGWS